MNDIKYLLQRKLLAHDQAKWRTVTRVSKTDAQKAMQLAAEIARIGEPMNWRVVIDDAEQKPVAHWLPSSGWN